MMKSILKYNSRVFFAMRLLFSDVFDTWTPSPANWLPMLSFCLSKLISFFFMQTNPHIQQHRAYKIFTSILAPSTYKTLYTIQKTA